MNNLFNVVSITLNYSLNTTGNHKVIGHLGPLLLNGSFDAKGVGVGDVMGGLLQNSTHGSLVDSCLGLSILVYDLRQGHQAQPF